MLVKKPPVQFVPARNYRNQLELLYARRIALDALIRSLMDYDRLRAKRLETLKQKTA